MFIDKNTVKETSNENLFLEGVFYINTAQWLLAYLIFEKLSEDSNNKNVPLLYNMALCSFNAKKHKNTISNLEEALRFLSFPVSQINTTKPIPEALFENEYNNSHYKNALTASIINLNQEEIKLRIRRLLVDTHLEVENWKEIIRLSALPNMQKCENIRIALEKAKIEEKTQ